MSYENLKSTKMLATNCAACGRALRDAVSVELGIGPDCREKYGYNEGPEANRLEANHLIFLAADAKETIPATEACVKLRELGFAKLAEKILTRFIGIRLVQVANVYMVYTPFTEVAVNALRAIPGRTWNPENKANMVPVHAKNSLWKALKKAFPGQSMLGPDGQVIQIPA
jgi:Family of unknown function (DUF6011)